MLGAQAALQQTQIAGQGSLPRHAWTVILGCYLACEICSFVMFTLNII